MNCIIAVGKATLQAWRELKHACEQDSVAIAHALVFVKVLCHARRIRSQQPCADRELRANLCTHTQEEEEVLYPPLTYLQPISEQTIKREQGSEDGGGGAMGSGAFSGHGHEGGKVIMVKPSFPS